MTCIYCRNDGPYTREHILQQAFGATAVLNDVVCGGCNNAFSPLDQAFVEAVNFYHLGVNMLRRLGLGLAVGADGIALWARRRNDGFAEHPPQFVETKPDEWRFTASAEGAFDLVATELNTPARLVVQARVVPNDGTRARRHILRSAPYTYLIEGIDFASVESLRMEMTGPGLKVVAGSREVRREGPGPAIKFDTSLALVPFGRALAKIALNLVCHRLGAATALSSAFDPLRLFARHGQGDLWQFIKPSLLMGMDNTIAAPWITGQQHVLMLMRNGRVSPSQDAVFVVVGGKFIGTVLLHPRGNDGGLPSGTWSISRCDPELHTWEDFRMPDDAFRAIVNPAALGLKPEWDAIGVTTSSRHDSRMPPNVSRKWS